MSSNANIVVEGIPFSEPHPVLLVCERCGAVVSMGRLSIHADWHNKEDR